MTRDRTGTHLPTEKAEEPRPAPSPTRTSYTVNPSERSLLRCSCGRTRSARRIRQSFEQLPKAYRMALSSLILKSRPSEAGTRAPGPLDALSLPPGRARCLERRAFRRFVQAIQRLECSHAD